MSNPENLENTPYALINSLVSMGLLELDAAKGFVFPSREALIAGLSTIEPAELAAVAADACIGAVELFVALAKDESYDTQLMDRAVKLAAWGKGRKAAAAKLAKDPKQVSKAAAKALWEEWQLGRLPKNIRTTEQFAMEVMRRWPDLKSAKNICAWSAKWNKEAALKRKANPVS